MKILLVDDHAVVREGLRRLIGRELPSAIVEEAESAEAATERVAQEAWALVVLDLSMPGRSGLDALADLRAMRPRLPILVMTMHADPEYVERAFRSGASGYVTKGSDAVEILLAVHKTLAGGRYLSPAVAEALVATLGVDRSRPRHERLSERELQVLRRMGAGRTVGEIALELGLSDKTISTYRARILEKLELRTTAELIRYAITENIAG